MRFLWHTLWFGSWPARLLAVGAIAFGGSLLVGVPLVGPLVAVVLPTILVIALGVIVVAVVAHH